MSISPGSRLGPYEVLSMLGAGGMGQVWRGRDTRLSRDVAIKVLPVDAAENEAFRIRFDREAKAISSLNHPHICTLYDVGEQGGLHYFVMELLDGESLAERLARGPLPLQEALRYGAEIADALDASHRRGVVHRDLKPGNIMLTKSGAKLVDFGLAKLSTPFLGGEHSTIETIHRPVTGKGTLIGTFQYMAPEQFEGKPADHRTDVFALGTVLYEMVSGRRAFEGSSLTSVIGAVVSSTPPPVGRFAPVTPPALENVIQKCLEKNPEHRWQSARDVGSQLRWISGAGSPSRVAGPAGLPMTRNMLVVAAAALGWMAALAAASWALHERRAAEPLRAVFRSDLATSPETAPAFVGTGPIALSPDGRRLVYRMARDPSLAVYDFTTGKLLSLQGTLEATFPFWSPDSRWIGFFSEGKLKKIDANGGAVQILCDAREGRGGSWNRGGTIVFAPDVAGTLLQFREGGGAPTPVTRGENVSAHRNPFFLPDGKRFLFTLRGSRADPVGSIAMGSLDDPAVKILGTGSNPQFANGFLFFVRDRNLLAQRFEPDEGALTGPATPIAQNIDYFNPRDIGNYSVSPSGMIAFRENVPHLAQLVWADRTGRVLSVVGEPGLFALGRRTFGSGVATLIRRDGTDQESVWVMDLQRGVTTRATENFRVGTASGIPSPHDSQIAVSTLVATDRRKASLWLQSPSGGGEVMTLNDKTLFLLEDWSSDGKVLIGVTQAIGTGNDIVWLALADPAAIHMFAPSRHNHQVPRLSPNGRWIAYQSNEGGTNETYVSDFPEGKQRIQVTRNGGQPAQWQSDGRELIVVQGSRLIAYPIAEKGNQLDIGSPAPIPSIADPVAFVAADGDKLLMLQRVGEAGDEPVRIIRNWQGLVR